MSVWKKGDLTISFVRPVTVTKALKRGEKSNGKKTIFSWLRSHTDFVVFAKSRMVLGAKEGACATC